MLVKRPPDTSRLTTFDISVVQNVSRTNHYEEARLAALQSKDNKPCAIQNRISLRHIVTTPQQAIFYQYTCRRLSRQTLYLLFISFIS